MMLMRRLTTGRKGFTLIELLVVMTIMAILAAILFPVFAKVKSAARKNTCTRQIKQLTLAAQMYLADNDDCFPANTGADGWNPWFHCQSPGMAANTIELHGGTMSPYFRGLYQGANYINTAGGVNQSRIIVCPDWKIDMYPIGGPYSDGIYATNLTECEQYRSYGNNGALHLQAVGQIGDPASFVMIAENAAYGGYCSIEYPSVYRPAKRHGGGKLTGMGFVDGHAKMTQYKDLWNTDGVSSWTMWNLTPIP